MTELTTSEIIKRGLSRKCPSCGEGSLLRSYLTPNKQCSKCGLDFEQLRSDDGPAWATILISGHLCMPFTFWVLELGFDNTAIEIALPVLFILILSAIILPLAKGVFMAIIWMMHVQNKKEDDE